MMRAKAGIETFNKDRKAIVVTEIPYQVNKARLVERIAQLVNDKVVDDISDIRDESDRDGMRIVVELKRDGEPQIVLNQLFKHTQMQESFSMILLAVVNGQPKEMGLVQAIKHFIDHRVDVVRRRTAFLLSKAKDREHILEGYLAALDHLDNVITIIRASANRAEARENLVAYFAGKKIDINTTGRAPKRDPEKPFTGIQADAILELQLHRLTKLSIDEITKELTVTREHIAEYESILSSEKKLRGVIVKELEEVKKLYGDERRTVIEDEAAEIHLEDLIADEQVAVTVSHGGYMKRTPISTYRMQRRGGTGRTGMKTRDEDFVEHLFIASTHAYILIFTNTGRVYWLKVYEIPDVSAAGKGKHVGNLVGLQPGETVRTMLAVRNLEEAGKYIFFATRNGTGEEDRAEGLLPRDARTASTPSASSRATNWSQPTLPTASRSSSWPRTKARPSASTKKTSAPWAARHTASGASAWKRATTWSAWRQRRKPSPRQSRCHASASGAGVPRSPTDGCRQKGSLILSVTENGYGKRTPADEYRLQGRGGSGVINVKTTERNGKVVGIAQVRRNPKSC